jgi:hypothetical protein
MGQCFFDLKKHCPISSFQFQYLENAYWRGVQIHDKWYFLALHCCAKLSVCRLPLRWLATPVVGHLNFL